MLGQKRFETFGDLFDFVFSRIDHSKTIPVQGLVKVQLNEIIGPVKDVLRNTLLWSEESIKQFLTAETQIAICDYYHALRRMVTAKNIMREKTDLFHQISNKSIESIGHTFLSDMDLHPETFPALMTLCYQLVVLECNNAKQLNLITTWLRDQLEQDNIFIQSATTNISVDDLNDMANDADTFWYRSQENIFRQAEFITTTVEGKNACISFQWTSSTMDVRIVVGDKRLC